MIPVVKLSSIFVILAIGVECNPLCNNWCQTPVRPTTICCDIYAGGIPPGYPGAGAWPWVRRDGAEEDLKLYCPLVNCRTKNNTELTTCTTDNDCRRTHICCNNPCDGLKKCFVKETKKIVRIVGCPEIENCTSWNRTNPNVTICTSNNECKRSETCCRSPCDARRVCLTTTETTDYKSNPYIGSQTYPGPYANPYCNYPQYSSNSNCNSWPYGNYGGGLGGIGGYTGGGLGGIGGYAGGGLGGIGGYTGGIGGYGIGGYAGGIGGYDIGGYAGGIGGYGTNACC